MPQGQGEDPGCGIGREHYSDLALSLGVPDKGEGRGEGRHPSRAAASDLRRKTNVGHHPRDTRTSSPYHMFLTMLSSHSGWTIKQPATISSRAVRLSIWCWRCEEALQRKGAAVPGRRLIERGGSAWRRRGNPSRAIQEAGDDIS